MVVDVIMYGMAVFGVVLATGLAVTFFRVCFDGVAR